MMTLAGFLILLGVPFALWLSGAWCGRYLGATSGERLAWSLLAGLAAVLFSAAALNAFVPLRGWAAWFCFAPSLLSLLDPALRVRAREAKETQFSRRGLILLISAAIFLMLLLAPLTRPGALFYDGTTNHDAFFWITGAERLQSHSYLEIPPLDRDHPVYNATLAISGWQPAWGRMGAEAWVALISSLTGAPALHVYLFASAALFCGWVAAVFLTVRAFITERLSNASFIALGAAQPLFAFYHHNENLPNLLGMLSGATAVLALHEALRATENARALLSRASVGALAFHGLLCSYPEMVPFILLPIGALALHRIAQQPNHDWRIVAVVVSTLLIGAALNPATAIRAWHGFSVSLASARANSSWANILGTVEPTQFLPALLTLSAKAGRELGLVGGAIVSLALVAAAAFTLHRARARLGLVLVFSGALVLALYTATTGFLYGWQKTVQFSGVFITAVLPVGLVAILGGAGDRSAWRRAALVGVVVFFVYAHSIILLDLWKWSGRKTLSSDWLALAPTLRQSHVGRVVVHDATFSHAFFHGMWSTYFLRDVTVSYAPGGTQSGGYLRDSVVVEIASDSGAAHLVSRAWADTSAGTAPRLLTGREFVLLAPSSKTPAPQ